LESQQVNDRQIGRRRRKSLNYYYYEEEEEEEEATAQTYTAKPNRETNQTNSSTTYKKNVENVVLF
jgi:hypothetical protein